MPEAGPGNPVHADRHQDELRKGSRHARRDGRERPRSARAHRIADRGRGVTMTAPQRKLRPAPRPEAQAGPRSGRHIPQTMEASENAGMPLKGNGGTALHRIDPDRVLETLGSAGHAAGYSRLELMLTSVLPRLVGETTTSKTD